MKFKPKLIVICGPTATGKSDLAVKIAKKIGGEVISADSRQVYKGLNIGSGKITKKEMKGVPHYLLDMVSPKKVFTVSDFQKIGTIAINKILSINKIPIICGGTGFYIDALVKNLVFPDVKPNLKFRMKTKGYKIERLQKILLKLDPKRFKNIDKNNKVRLIRAIEIAKTLGKVSEIKSEKKYDCLYIGLSTSPGKLKEKIKIRLEKRLKIGMIAEVRNLHKNGLSWKRLESFGLEYRYIALYLQNKIPLKHFAKQNVWAIKSTRFDLAKDEMVTKLKTEIWHFAKRQMTWLKRNKDILWFKPDDKETFRKVEVFLK